VAAPPCTHRRRGCSWRALRQRALLLRLVALLLLLLFLHPAHPPEAAEQRAHAGADGGALAGIAADGAADRAQGRAAGRATEHPALGRPGHGRRRRRGHLRIRWIEPGLLDGPAVALAAIELLLLGALAPLGIHVRLSRGRRGERDTDRTDVDQDQPSQSSRHEAPSGVDM
jgi:hypothetical protein